VIVSKLKDLKRGITLSKCNTELFKYMLKFKTFSKSILTFKRVTLTLSRHKGNMVSAHPLVEMNISAKFEENPSVCI